MGSDYFEKRKAVARDGIPELAMPAKYALRKNVKMNNPALNASKN